MCQCSHWFFVGVDFWRSLLRCSGSWSRLEFLILTFYNSEIWDSYLYNWEEMNIPFFTINMSDTKRKVMKYVKWQRRPPHTYGHCPFIECPADQREHVVRSCLFSMCKSPTSTQRKKRTKPVNRHRKTGVPMHPGDYCKLVLSFLVAEVTGESHVQSHCLIKEHKQIHLLEQSFPWYWFLGGTY